MRINCPGRWAGIPVRAVSTTLLTNKVYRVFDVRTDTRRQNLEGICNGTPRAIDSKQDWVLFSKQGVRNRKTWLCFYNPFTGEIIELPDTDYRKINSACNKQACQRFQFLRRVWSSVFILSGIVSVCVNCKPGDKKWSKRGIAGDFDSVEDVKYMDGVLYCCLNPRVIGAFTVTSNDWKLLPHPYSERASRTHYESFSCGVRW